MLMGSILNYAIKRFLDVIESFRREGRLPVFGRSRDCMHEPCNLFGLTPALHVVRWELEPFVLMVPRGDLCRIRRDVTSLVNTSLAVVTLPELDANGPAIREEHLKALGLIVPALADTKHDDYL